MFIKLTLDSGKKVLFNTNNILFIMKNENNGSRIICENGLHNYDNEEIMLWSEVKETMEYIETLLEGK